MNSKLKLLGAVVLGALTLSLGSWTYAGQQDNRVNSHSIGVKQKKVSGKHKHRKHHIKVRSKRPHHKKHSRNNN